MDIANSDQAHERTVAFIDDDSSMREAAGDLLRSNHLRVEVFASAEDFLRYAFIDSVVCLVVDILMPGMGGFELQNHLERQGRSLPTVFISAQQHASLTARAKQLGAAFLAKPFSEIGLLSTLQAVCGRRIDLPH
jgi:FixJ family two-component response regulator